MKYFGIKVPKKENQESFIWWISDSKHNAWMSFFTIPDKDKNLNAFRLPLDEAVKAYESIGYKCVELEITEKVKK